MKWKSKLVFGVLLLLTASYTQLVAAGNPNPRVLPINSYPYGMSYGIWGQEFSNWLYHFSLAEFPLFQGDDLDCATAQSGQVWFLAGVLGGPGVAVTRSCTVPPGKALFISVNSVVSFAPLFGETEQDVRDDASRDLDGTATTTGVEELYIWVDGVELDNAFGYRASSPEGGYILSVEEGTILAEIGIPVDDYAPAIVDGYWVMLAPLSAGEHTVQWRSTGQNQYGETYDYTVTWNLTVGK